jgi:hypothetical protein
MTDVVSGHERAVASSPSEPPAAARARRRIRPGALLAIVLTGQFMAVLDGMCRS